MRLKNEGTIQVHAGFGWGRAETYPGMNPGKAPRAHQTPVG